MKKNYSKMYTFFLMTIFSTIITIPKNPWTEDETRKMRNFIETTLEAATGAKHEFAGDIPTSNQLNISQSKTPETDAELQLLLKSIIFLKTYTDCMVEVVSFVGEEAKNGAIKGASNDQISSLQHVIADGGGHRLLGKALIMLRWLEDNQYKYYSRLLKEKIEESPERKEEYDKMGSFQKYFLLKNSTKLILDKLMRSSDDKNNDAKQS